MKLSSKVSLSLALAAGIGIGLGLQLFSPTAALQNTIPALVQQSATGAIVTDQVTLTFVDAHLRPAAEALRALEARVEDLENAWNNLGGAGAHTGTDTIENRTDKGVQAVTWTDVTNTVTALQAARDVVTETAGRAGLIQSLCVQPLQVN